MIRHTILFLSAVATILFAYSQWSEPIYTNGFYVIQDRPFFKKGDAVFDNPLTMPDRIILDSAKRMIAKKTSFPMGYTYYEWRRTDGFKTYQEIRIWPLKYNDCVHYTDTGQVRVVMKDKPETNNNFYDAEVVYYRDKPNPKYRYNGFNIAQKIRVVLTTKVVDSLVLLYNIPKHKLLKGTHWWTEFNFSENGCIKSTGLVVTGLKEAGQPSSDLTKAPDNQFKIGEWLYYDEQGKQFYNEKLSELKRIR